MDGGNQITPQQLELLTLLVPDLPRWVGAGIAWQVELHGKGTSVQIRVSSVQNLSLRPPPKK